MPRALSEAPAGWRLRGLAALALCVFVVVALLVQTGGMRLVDNRIFDYLVTITPPEPSGEVVVVAIDEPSMAEIGLQWPWPRNIHAELIEQLRNAGASAIGMDIIFAEPSAVPGADDALGATLGPDVVLAGDESIVEAPQGDQLVRLEPLSALLETGAAVGIASIPLDADATFRRIPNYPDGFARQLLAAAGRPAEATEGEILICSFGPARTIPTVSYYQALDPAGFLPDGFLRDKIVVVGMSTQVAMAADKGGADVHPTSHTARTGRLVSGVEIQATIAETLARGLGVERKGPAWPILAAGLAALFAVGLVRRSSDIRTALQVGLSGAAMLAASYLLIRHGGIYVSPAAPLTALVLVAGGQAGFDYAAERRRRSGITRAFSQYLSPHLVGRLAENPESLRLGGERRELTVLFCDVRGFTTVAERLKDDPERLTTLMNRLITPLSQAVLAESGTIDKYIGDCVMAFWNAPLDEPDHALRAVRAGLAMLDAIDRLNEDLAAEASQEGVEPVRLRIGIGINTGDCVVGNMGSEMRFAYTAMGDPVNLAARLESESKAMALPILIGAETARRITGALSPVALHTIRVKGKDEPVRPFTLLRRGGIGDIAAVHEEAVAAMDAGDGAALDRALGRLPAEGELAAYHAVLRAAAAGLKSQAAAT